MMRKNRAVLLALLVSVVVTALLAGLAWQFDFYWLTPIWAVAVEAIILLSVMVMIGTGCFWLLRRPKADVEQKKKDDWRSEEIKNRFNQIWRKHSRLASNPYQIPWYIHLSEKAAEDETWLQQMGFDSVDSSEAVPDDLLALQFWASDSAILVSVDMSASKEALAKSMDTLFSLILKKRARQAFNGVLCSVNLGRLIDLNEIAVNELSQKYRALLEELNKKTGLSLPVYTIFTNIAQVKDFCELFSTLNETEREQPFGDLADLENGKSYHKEWFDNSFSKLTQGLSNSISLSLKQQLNADYRDSAVAGVFQLNAIRFDVEDFLSLTFSQHQFDDTELFFRGYFFLNAGGEAQAFDLVSSMHASDLGFESLQSKPNKTKSLSLFGKRLFRSCILNEHPLVGVNRKKEIVYRTSRAVLTGGLALLFVGFLMMLKAGFGYQQSLDSKALTMLERYKENLENNEIQPDDLSSPVFSLYELREINQLYHQDNQPWYVSRWLPDSSIAEYVNDAYYKELETELLTLMRDYILKDMFVYNSLDDKVKTLELLNLQQILYNPERHSAEQLVEYYTDTLKEEGSADADLLERFRLIAQDVLTTSAVPPAYDEQLLELVRATLSSRDVSELLYQHILQHKDFSHRVDIRRKFSPSYESLFSFSPDFSGYLVPYAFTREGFEDLSNETGFQLASEAIKAYEGVMGRISGDAEMNRINRQLRERYINDYIKHWKAITANVVWTEVSNWGESELQLDLATDANFSPLVQFYRLVEVHTNLTYKTQESAPEEGESEEVQESPRTGAMQRVAESISYPFRNIHNIVQPNDAGQSPMDIAVSQMIAARDWVAKSKEIQYKGRYFLEQMQNTDASNPIAQLDVLAEDYNAPLLPSLMRGQASVINALALDAMRRVINNDWGEVSQFYESRLSNNYPFYKSSDTDASVSDVEAFFKPEGLFEQFADKYSVYFEVTDSKDIYLKGFIPHQYQELSWRYLPFRESVIRLQKSLFTEGKLGFEFQIKAVRMSPTLTRFALESGLKLFEYQNGPKFWRMQSWPITANQSQSISIYVSDASGAVQREKVSGEWSWFKIAEKMNSASQFGTDNVLWRYLVDQNEVNLQVKSASLDQPFSPSFFTDLKIPAKL